MKVTKLISLILVIVCLGTVMLSTVSCGDSYESTGWHEDTDKTKKSAAYESFTGQKLYAFEVKDPIAINIKIATASGEFYAEIYAKDVPSAPIFTVNVAKTEGGTTAIVNAKTDAPIALTGDFTDTVSIATPGDYIIRVNGAAHNGSFLFDW